MLRLVKMAHTRAGDQKYEKDLGDVTSIGLNSRYGISYSLFKCL